MCSTISLLTQVIFDKNSCECMLVSMIFNLNTIYSYCSLCSSIKTKLQLEKWFGWCNNDRKEIESINYRGKTISFSYRASSFLSYKATQSNGSFFKNTRSPRSPQSKLVVFPSRNLRSLVKVERYSLDWGTYFQSIYIRCGFKIK
jgi:hypothetical protein